MGNSVSQTFTDFGNSVKDVAVSAWNGVSGAAKSLGDGAVGFVTNLANGQPGEAFASVGNGLIGAGQAAVEGVAGAGKAVVGGAADLVNNVGKVGSEAVDVVTDGVQAVAHVVGAGDAVRSTLDAVDQGARTVTNNVGHAADAVSSVATTVIDGQQQVVSTAAEGAQQVVSEVMQGDLAGAAEAVGSAVTNTAESAANMVSSSNGALLDAGNGWVENTFRENMQLGGAVTHAVGDVAGQLGVQEVAAAANAGTDVFNHLADNPQIASGAVQDFVAAMPGFGHVLGASQAMAGRFDEAADTLMSANAGTVATIGGMVAGPAGAMAGLTAGELMNTGINAAVNGGEWEPTGFIERFDNAANGRGDVGVNIASGVLDVVSAGVGDVSGDKVVEQVAEAAGDVLAGAGTVVGNINKPPETAGGDAAAAATAVAAAALAAADTQPAQDQNAGPSSASQDVDLSGISFPGQPDPPAPQPAAAGGSGEPATTAAPAGQQWDQVPDDDLSGINFPAVDDTTPDAWQSLAPENVDVPVQPEFAEPTAWADLPPPPSDLAPPMFDTGMLQGVF